MGPHSLSIPGEDHHMFTITVSSLSDRFLMEVEPQWTTEDVKAAIALQKHIDTNGAVFTLPDGKQVNEVMTMGAMPVERQLVMVKCASALCAKVVASANR